MHWIRNIRTAGTVAILLAMTGGAVLVTAPSASAQGRARYGNLPIMDRDWTRLPMGPGGTDPVAREQQRQAEVNRRWHRVHEIFGEHHVSRRSADLLRRRGFGGALLDKSPRTTFPTAKATPEDPDILKVLIIRVGFEENREPALTSMMPDGGYDVIPSPDRQDTLYVDPAPHGHDFFAAHLEGLKQFYGYQSGGRLVIDGEVLPRQMPGEPERWYTMSDIADYGPGTGGFWNLDENLETPGNIERFVREMITAADEGTQADGGPSLADFDDDNDFTYIIFVHSGSDWQSDIKGDSPNDLPTFFISMGEPQPLTSTDSVTGETGALSEISLIPETTNQDGYAGSIAAALYHEFGHALGLPDVYNTYSGLPSVGLWDLMDSGTNLPVPLGFINDVGDTIRAVATGVLPPSLSAWNKWFLGWLRMGDVLNQDTDMRLPAVQVPEDQYRFYSTVNPGFNRAYPQAIRAGVSPREWFLLENRWVPLNAGETPYDDIYFRRDGLTGVIQWLAGDWAGESVNTGLYDYFLPAGGMLVWHVNMDRIEEGLPTNEINIHGDGLKLVEADGIQDIGVLNAYVLGWYGSELDPFGGRSGDDGVYNGLTELYVEGFPNSRCFDRTWTGFSLSDVRDEGRNPAVLRFGAGLDPVLKDFPWTVHGADTTQVALPAGAVPARALHPGALTTVDVGDALFAGEVRSVLIFADAPPDGWDDGSWRAGLYSLRQNGTVRWLSGDWRDENGDVTAKFAELDAPVAGPPVAWGMDDDSGRLLVGDVFGAVTFFELHTNSRPPTVLWSTDLGDSLLEAPLVVHQDGVPTAALCFMAPDQLVLLDLADGNALGPAQELCGHGLGDVTGRAGRTRLLPGWNEDEWITTTDAGWFHCRPGAGTPIVLHAVAWPEMPEGPVQTLVVGGDAPVFAAFDDDGLIRCWDPGGTVLDDLYPADAALVTEPAVADLDGDGGADVVAATATRVLAWRGDGSGMRGFPRPLRDMFPVADTTRISGPLVVADADGDGANEVIFGTDGGHLFQLAADGKLRPRSPYRFGDRAGGSFAIADGNGDGAPRVLWLLTPGGYAGEPLDRQLVHGRLTAFGLATAAADDARTSEWRGPDGGGLRRGPEGTARHLEAASPLLAEADRPIVYPNPLRDDDLTVRFYSAGDTDALFIVHDLEGEIVLKERFVAAPRTLNEHIVRLPGLASGLYVCRLQWDAPDGRKTRTMTLAVEK